MQQLQRIALLRLLRIQEEWSGPGDGATPRPHTTTRISLHYAPIMNTREERRHASFGAAVLHKASGPGCVQGHPQQPARAAV